MCGIAGQVGRDPRTIQRRYAAYCAMQQTLARRGPDQRGMYICGAAALALPVIALARRKNALSFAAASMGLCAFSLLGQIFEYNTRVNVQDWSALLDTSYAILFCAAVLVALALVLNIAACLRAMKQ